MEENLSSDYSSRNSIYSTENTQFLKTSNDSIREKSISFTKIISEILTDICEENKSNLDTKVLLLKPFVSKKIPTISIKDYIERLLKYSKTFNEIIIIVLIYLDTICAKHKLNYYSKLGGIPKKEATKLEYEFMSLIDFKLFVNQKLYEKYYNYLSSLENDDIDDEFDIEVN